MTARWRIPGDELQTAFAVWKRTHGDERLPFKYVLRWLHVAKLAAVLDIIETGLQPDEITRRLEFEACREDRRRRV